MSDNLPAVRESGNVPALASTPALAGIDVSALKLPKLYRGEFQAGLVQEGVVPVGCIYAATSPDDPEPEIVLKDAYKDDALGVLVHVLHVEENWSGTIGGEFRTFELNDPSRPAFQDNGKRLDRGYIFTVAAPDVDPELPLKVVMSKTSRGCGGRIVLRLMRHRGNIYDLGFRLRLKKRESEAGGQKFRWFVWQEALATDVTEEQLAVAAKLGASFNTALVEHGDVVEASDNTEPAI